MNDKKNNGAFLIDIAVPGDTKVERKQQEKVDKYQNRAREIRRFMQGLSHRYRRFGNDSKRSGGQGRIKASAGPGAVPNAGPLQTYNQLTAFGAFWLQQAVTLLNRSVNRSELLKIFHSHQLRAPKTAGAG